jgi:hypothetical protein
VNHGSHLTVDYIQRSTLLIILATSSSQFPQRSSYSTKISTANKTTIPQNDYANTMPAHASFHSADMYHPQDATNLALKCEHHNGPHNHQTAHFARILTIVLKYMIGTIVIGFFMFQALEFISFLIFHPSPSFMEVFLRMVVPVFVCNCIDIWLEINGVVIFEQTKRRIDGWYVAVGMGWVVGL